jgi:hypothetical protein
MLWMRIGERVLLFFTILLILAIMDTILAVLSPAPFGVLWIILVWVKLELIGAFIILAIMYYDFQGPEQIGDRTSKLLSFLFLLMALGHIFAIFLSTI